MSKGIDIQSEHFRILSDFNTLLENYPSRMTGISKVILKNMFLLNSLNNYTPRVDHVDSSWTPYRGYRVSYTTFETFSSHF
jgi:hypothetical protein